MEMRLLLVCVAACIVTAHAQSEKCAKALAKAEAMLNEMFETEKEPECAKKHELKKYMTASANKEEEVEKIKAFDEYMATLDAESQAEIGMCVLEMAGKAMEGTEVVEDCKEDFQVAIVAAVQAFEALAHQ